MPIAGSLTTSALLTLCLAGLLSTAMAATYYVSSDGSDDNAGTSADAPWAGLGRVNSADLQPGDSVLFRRGDSWRGSLRPRSGAEGAPITYGAYGEGEKPVLMGSVDKSAPTDWRDEGGNLWATGHGPERPEPRLPAVGEETDLGWGVHSEAEAKATGAVTEEGFTVTCAAQGKAGNHIQLIGTGLRIEAGKTYRLVLRAKSTLPFGLRMPQLMSAGPPWSGYSSGPAPSKVAVETDRRSFVQFYTANADSENARLTFYLGESLPEGAILTLDKVQFAPCDPSEIPVAPPGALPVDVGNLILSDEAECGVKVWNKEDLKTQGQFWYDEDRELLHVYSEENPARRYGTIECALHRHIVNQSNTSWVVYENLWLKYGGAHGFGGGSTHHLVIRDCDISFIGGADQYGGDRTVRYGNGIEFWGAAHDNLVERCRIWEIYDAALTNQSGGTDVKQYNLTYRNNLIWNSEYSFEYWNRPETSETYNVKFVHNTCLNAGHGWGHAQRPDPSGRHLCFYQSPAKAWDIVIKNNVFYEATKNAFYAPAWPRDAMEALDIDNNLWCQAEGDMVAVAGSNYTMAQFARYQAEQGKEPGSLVGDPLLRDPRNLDFHLTAGSPCIDAGADVGIEADFEGNEVPQGMGPDIGAYESGG